MSVFSRVTINRGNGGLGIESPSGDGIAGLVIMGVAAAGIAMETPTRLTSLEQAEGLGLDASYDETNSVLVYYHIFEFFRINPAGILWVILTDNTQPSWVEMVLSSNTTTGAMKLLDAAAGEIRLLAIAFNPETSYTPLVSTAMDSQVEDVVGAAQDLVLFQRSENNPFHVLVEGRMFQVAAVGAATDLRTLASPDVSVVVGRDLSDKVQDMLDTVSGGTNPHVYRHACLGTLLGIVSKFAVNECVGWIEKGDIQDSRKGRFLVPGLSSGSLLSALSTQEQRDLDAKGYIFVYKDVDAPGTYFNDSHTCTLATDDYYCIENCRVMNKAQKVVRAALVPFVNSPVRFNADGTIDRLTIENLTRKGMIPIEKMEAAGEISEGDLFIDPKQNVLANGNLEVQYEIVPTGTARRIVATISFRNPFSA